MNDANVVKVGMADLKIAAGGAILKTTGLGSCVGLTLFDERTKVAGMVHVMLPSSEIAREASINIAKYADTSIPHLIELMRLEGAEPKRFVAKMAGGAQMFAFHTNNDSMRIGPRNVESCKQMLKQFNIPVLSEDTGLNYGRTIEFCSMSGKMTIRSVQQGVKEI
ncbi:chemotaxis protein CheD [Paenibacillus rhizovicinus]|uniref:Probable chemoreceptor glutamine deamidase CheD n=1 Tax=Paenibacillus rhizovicinus TaxID=2704463 RepID=A0A6C0NV39_9BACL|nr:chemotaxis protein CheD [Paenibacillus rhizovicinus]QHW30045.1 chemotaxis protein CheD [Paenibacillus rhizovicinus]